MKSLTKRVNALMVVFAIIATLIIGSGFFIDVIAFAADTVDHSYKYFYGQLIEGSMEQRFYNAFEKLANSGEFKKGVLQYDLVANGVVTKDEATAYVNGNTLMAEAYSAGRDAFYMDHPDLFYVDLFSTSISAGQNSSGDSVAYLDTSRALSTYRGNLNSEDAVNNAINVYEAKLNAIIAEADKKADAKAKIEYVNEYIATHVEYGFGTEVRDGRNVDTDKAPFIYTSYGALVNGESVCEGYAKSFKAVMDRLEIPCVCVQGYADGSNDGTYEPHMWNYVRVDGMWYMVDPTYNASYGESTHKYDSWLLCGGEKMHLTHTEDGVVSTSGYELKYPALKPYDYGVDTDSNGMSVVGEYVGEGDSIQLNIHVSYDDKGALKLQDEGKYLAFRMGEANDEGSITWENWYNVEAYNIAAKESYDMSELPYITTDTETVMRYVSWEYVQFTIMDAAPTVSKKVLPFDNAKEYVIAYDSAVAGIVAPTAPYHNETYKSVNPAPFGFGTPSNSSPLFYDKTYDIRIVYSDELERLDPTLPVGIDFSTSVSDDIAHEHAVISNFNWDEGSKEVTFTFTPSKMYIHNNASYYFTLTNMVGVKSHKIPDPVLYSVRGKSVVCSKVFNDGRLYMNVFGAPKMLDNSDLSVTDFKDENGNYYAASQRSQLMLVASKPTAAQEQKMDEVLKRDTPIKDEDILASSTYEINLQICGVVKKVPNGSYMQVAFGFPEGYDPSDAGTTFKIYHYKHDDQGNITGVEEIPVIITEYGLIAKVTSFSPFTIVQVKNTSAAVTNSKTYVYATVNGNSGGTITSNGNSGISEVVGNSISYDIKADAGYQIGSVKLNGKVLDSSLYKNGKLTLKKDDVQASNTLEVTFVTEQSAKSYASQGINISFGEKHELVIPDSNAKGMAIAIVVTVLVIAVGCLAAFLILNNKPAVTQTEGGSVSDSTDSSKADSKSKSKTSDKKSETKKK